MKTKIKRVADDIYHLIIDEADVCEFYGQYILEFIENKQITKSNSLILETQSNRRDIACDNEFLRACRHFEDIAYVVEEETATYNPWKHAILIRNNNKNTHYFDSYDDAFNWLVSHRQKTARKAPLDFTRNIYKSNG